MPVTVIRAEPLSVAHPVSTGVDEAVIRRRVVTAPGELHRSFWQVPAGATWADLIVRGYHITRPRLYMLDIVQLQPHTAHKDASCKRTLTVGVEPQTIRYLAIHVSRGRNPGVVGTKR